MENENVEMKELTQANSQHHEHGSSCKAKRKKTPLATVTPLLINHILEKIFDGASINDLKVFRLTCREWHHVATKKLQSSLDFITIGCRNINHIHSLHYGNFNQQRNNHFFMNQFPLSPESIPLVTHSFNAEQLNRFLEVISKSTNPPFAKYEIVSSFFVPENEQLLQRFFQFSSPFVQNLKISLNNQHLGEFSPVFLAFINFPKLRSVVFEVLREFTLAEPGIEDTDSLSSDLLGNAVSYRILSSICLGATNLESLEVSLQRKCNGEGQGVYNQDGTPNFERDRRAGQGGGGVCPCQHFDPTAVATLSIQNSPDSASSRNETSIISLPSIAVTCHLPIPITEYQSTPPRISNSPKLKKLHLRLRNSFIHQTCVMSLLQRLDNTLEELCFTEEGHGSPVQVTFPTMKRLSKLTISSICEFEQNFVTILPFSYSDQLPILKSMNLWDCFGTERRYEQLFLSSTPSHTLNELVFPSQLRNATLARNIPNVFPRLKSLTMVFSTRTESLAVIETVFEVCGESLEELHLITEMDTQNQNVDHVLTGLPKEICKKMRTDENFTLPLYLQEMTRKPSLISLTKLRKLMFQLEHKYSRAPLITDVTGYLAFMEMPNLEYLRFTRYGMSWNCCEALANKCRVDVLSPNANNVFEIENFDFDFEGV
ncbi:unnamed protein product [Orchesella dallaii]|uniref:F-box domain-containing protein n=1 Tax=Orchesella dallaii TaxID=48710 RepID=A0ABP1QLG8_9HEXA